MLGVETTGVVEKRWSRAPLDTSSTCSSKVALLNMLERLVSSKVVIPIRKCLY